MNNRFLFCLILPKGTKFCINLSSQPTSEAQLGVNFVPSQICNNLHRICRHRKERQGKDKKKVTWNLLRVLSSYYI
jgi:hypothetical protein